MRRAHVLLVLGLGILVVAGVSGLGPLRERGAKLAVGEALAASLIDAKSGARHRQWDDEGSMGLALGVPVHELTHCGVVRVSVMRGVDKELANCGTTAVKCVAPADQRVVGCRPVEIRQVEPSAAGPTGSREEPRCTGGYFGALKCVVTLEGPAPGRTLEIVVR